MGCDASNAGDQLDILRTAALAAGLAKDMAVDATAMTAARAFELATVSGAAAIGMADEIGSLEPGKRADVVVLDTAAPEWTPRGDIALQLIWSATGHTVRDVIVDGRLVVRDRRCLTVDEKALRAEAARAAPALRRRAGIAMSPTWPLIPSAD